MLNIGKDVLSLICDHLPLRDKVALKLTCKNMYFFLLKYKLEISYNYLVHYNLSVSDPDKEQYLSIRRIRADERDKAVNDYAEKIIVMNNDDSYDHFSNCPYDYNVYHDFCRACSNYDDDCETHTHAYLSNQFVIDYPNNNFVKQPYPTPSNHSWSQDSDLGFNALETHFILYSMDTYDRMNCIYVYDDEPELTLTLQEH